MSGTDTNPQTGSGRTAETDARSDDGAAQLARALIAHLERIGTPSPPPDLSTTQARLATHYALLSNALGNFGRHGATRVALLSPPPTLSRQGKTPKLLLGPPIAGASTITTYDATGRPLQHLAYVAAGVEVQDPDRIVTVEVEDAHEVPFRVGFVTTPVNAGTY
jgi:hypothetical protein